MPARILIITSEFPPGPGGIGQHAFSLAESLAIHGAVICVLAPADNASPLAVEQFDKASRFAIIRFKRVKLLTYALRIIRISLTVYMFKPNRIMLSGKFPVWTLRWIKLLYSSASLEVFLHGSELNLPVRWQKKFFTWNLKKTDRLYPVSLFTQSMIPSECINKHCAIIPNGITPEELNDWNVSKTKKLKGYPALLTVGSITPRKGQHKVVEALPYLAKFFPDIHYHMVGLPKQHDQIMQLAASIGKLGCITIHGHIQERKDLAKYYTGCDCFIMLSENQADGDVEGFGIAILEANYFGVPAIGSEGNGIRDAILEGETGYTVCGNSAEQILNALQKILSNLSFFQANSKKWALQHDWNKIVKKIL